MSKNMRDYLEEILLFHQKELQMVQKRTHQQLQQQLQYQLQIVKQKHQAEVSALRSRIQELQERLRIAQQTQGTASTPTTSTESTAKTVTIEVELDVDGVFYLAELDILPVSTVNILEVTPGVVVPIEETTWSDGKLKRAGGLDDEAYDAIEDAINEEVERRLQRYRND